MSIWRIGLVGGLLGVPLAILLGLGAYHLFLVPYGWLVWWLFLALMASGYLLAAYWTRKRQLLPDPQPTPPMYWTAQDAKAYELVKARAEAAEHIDRTQMSQPGFYMTTAQQMADEITRFYHPNARDPVGSVTVPELLAVLELAFGDMYDLVEKTVPGGNLLTVDQWRHAKEWSDWAARTGTNLSNAYYAVAGLFDPINVGLRYLASRIGISTPLAALQQDLTLWFYKAFIARVGTYLIELQSGRLKVGARRYREALAQRGFRATEVSPTTPADPETITIALVGQVKAGKSSLINALLGEQRAVTSILPATDGVYRYELSLPGIPTKLVLLDTVGYGNAGPTVDQVRSTQDAIRQADIVLLVENARNAAREADRVLLATLDAWFTAQPSLRRPAFIGVLTHVDLLSPSLEWKPPYNWQNPTTPKEKNIAAAIDAAAEVLKPHLTALVPVRTDVGKEDNITEGLLPMIVARLDDSQAVALLRTLRNEIDRGQALRVLGQMREVGNRLWQYVRERWM